jgi:cytoskeletal protein CcmA (bactofilin family)
MWSQQDARQDRIKTAQPFETPDTANRKPVEADKQTAQFGRSIVVKGEVSGSEDLTIDGQVEGRISLADHALTIGPNATVCADITAKVVTIFGTVLGSITALDKIDVRRSGSVEGDVTCASLVVQDGAILRGKIETGGGRHATQARPAAA